MTFIGERSRQGLEDMRARWWATVSSGDLDGYLALFSPDAVWVTPELDEIEGRDAIRAWLEPVFAQFDYELTITVADVRVAGDLGIERARFVSRMTPKPPSLRPPASVDEPDEGPAPMDDALEAPEPEVDGGLDDAAGEEGGGRTRGALFALEDARSPEEDQDDGEDTGTAGEAAQGEAAPAEGPEDKGSDDEASEDEASGDEASDDGASGDEASDDEASEEAVEVDAPLIPGAGEDQPHEGRYLMYWRWYPDAGWLVTRYADVTGVG